MLNLTKNLSRKIRLPKEAWEQHLQEQSESGQSIPEYCKAHNLQPKRFYYWKSRLYKSTRNAFIPTIIQTDRMSAQPKLKPECQQRLGSLEFGESGKLNIESSEALAQVLEMIGRRI